MNNNPDRNAVLRNMGNPPTRNSAPVMTEQEAVGHIEKLLVQLKLQCNKHTNGQCQTLACLKRSGYQRPAKPDYNLATCEVHEQITAIETLLAYQPVL